MAIKQKVGRKSRGRSDDSCRNVAWNDGSDFGSAWTRGHLGAEEDDLLGPGSKWLAEKRYSGDRDLEILSRGSDGLIT